MHISSVHNLYLPYSQKLLQILRSNCTVKREYALNHLTIIFVFQVSNAASPSPLFVLKMDHLAFHGCLLPHPACFPMGMPCTNGKFYRSEQPVGLNRSVLLVHKSSPRTVSPMSATHSAKIILYGPFFVGCWIAGVLELKWGFSFLSPFETSRSKHAHKACHDSLIYFFLLPKWYRKINYSLQIADKTNIIPSSYFPTLWIVY